MLNISLEEREAEWEAGLHSFHGEGAGAGAGGVMDVVSDTVGVSDAAGTLLLPSSFVSA